MHVGGGPLARKLNALARDLGIALRVQWRGAMPQDALLREYRAADVFAIASRIARDGGPGKPTVSAWIGPGKVTLRGGGCDGERSL